MNRPNVSVLATPRRVLLFAALVLLSGSHAWAGVIYDAVNDFSLTGNPNGAWSYGTLNGGVFVPDAVPIANADYSGSLEWYNGLNLPNTAVIEDNATGATQAFSNTIVLPNDELRLDGQNNVDDVRWTAPSTGMVSITGLFQGIDTSQSSVLAQLLLNGSPQFGLGISSYGFPFNFNNSFPVNAGDVVDFSETPQVFFDDSIGLKATIDFTPVPEPAGLALAVIGLFGLVGVRRVNRSADKIREIAD